MTAWRGAVQGVLPLPPAYLGPGGFVAASPRIDSSWVRDGPIPSSSGSAALVFHGSSQGLPSWTLTGMWSGWSGAAGPSKKMQKRVPNPSKSRRVGVPRASDSIIMASLFAVPLWLRKRIVQIMSSNRPFHAKRQLVAAEVVEASRDAVYLEATTRDPASPQRRRGRRKRRP